MSEAKSPTCIPEMQAFPLFNFSVPPPHTHFGTRVVSFLIDSFSFESCLDRLLRGLENTRNKSLMTCKIMHNTRETHISWAFPSLIWS